MKSSYPALIAPLKNFHFLQNLLVHCLLLVPSQSSPLQAININSTFLDHIRPLNITAVTVPASPPGFSIDWRYEPLEPLNILAIYLSAIDCMYQFAQKGWDTEMIGGLKIRARGFAVEIDVESSHGSHGPLPLLTSHIVLGLYRTIEEMTRSKLFCKVTADLSLGQRQIGVLKIQTSVTGALSVGTASNATIGDPSTITATSPSGTAIDDDDPRFTIDYAYGGARIDSQDIFIAILDGLANSAQHADIARCQQLTAISASGKCEIDISEVAYPHQINYSFVTKALRILTWDVIVRLRTFAEMTFEMKWEGVGIAKGYIRKVERPGIEVARRDAKALP